MRGLCRQSTVPAMDHLAITPKMAVVLKIFIEDPGRPRYGFELMQLTRIQSGSLYPMLARLQRAGWLISGQEDVDPRAVGRPPRRNYTITADAAALAHDRLTAMSELFRPPEARP